MTYNVYDIVKDEVLGRAEYVDEQTYIDRVGTCMSCPNVVFHFPRIPSCKICRMLH